MLTATGQHVTAASIKEKFSVDMGLVTSMKFKNALCIKIIRNFE